jgi:hypothetical protein
MIEMSRPKLALYLFMAMGVVAAGFVLSKYIGGFALIAVVIGLLVVIFEPFGGGDDKDPPLGALVFLGGLVALWMIHYFLALVTLMWLMLWAFASYVGEDQTNKLMVKMSIAKMVLFALAAAGSASLAFALVPVMQAWAVTVPMFLLVFLTIYPILFRVSWPIDFGRLPWIMVVILTAGIWATFVAFHPLVAVGAAFVVAVLALRFRPVFVF